MNKIINFCIVFMILFGSCRNEEINYKIEEGTYQGIFYRYMDKDSFEIANVTLSFNNNEFEGNSDTWRYPVICKGNYLLSNKEITFNNSCGPWTADFDWTLILNGGPFEVENVGDKLYLTLYYNYSHYDRYELQLKR